MSSMVRNEPPKNTIKAYKAFVVFENDPGHLYPPMVASPSGMSTPVGVWLNASTGEVAMNKDGSRITNTLDRMRVQQGGPGTNKSKSGDLAWRPGWHLGEWPDAKQFAITDPETGKRQALLPPHFVFCECEIAADVDYQMEAFEYGMTEKNRFSRQLAGIPNIPKDGYYRYRTNPDPTTAPWYISGAMKVTRILDDEERRRICAEKGVTCLPRLGGDIDLAKYGLKAGPVEPTPQSELDKLPELADYSDEIKSLSGYVRRPLDFDNKTLLHEFVIDHIPPEKVAEYRANYVPPVLENPVQVSVVLNIKNRHKEALSHGKKHKEMEKMR